MRGPAQDGLLIFRGLGGFTGSQGVDSSSAAGQTRWEGSVLGRSSTVCVCMFVCVSVVCNQGLVQVIIYRGEGAGAAASPCHDGETLGRLAHSLGKRRLLGQVVGLCRGQREVSDESLWWVCCSKSETAPPVV